METRKRKNRIALINIILFAILGIVGILLITYGEDVAGWVMTLLSVVIIIYSSMSLLKRSRGEDEKEGR